eukprot:102513_1
MMQLLLIAIINSCECDQFHERLLLHPLPDRSLLVELKFDVITRYSDLKNMFYDLFPKSIGELFISLPLWEFDLCLTHGRWDYSKWGLLDNINVAPLGSELTGVFYNNKSNNDWLIFEEILTGLYCASINEINIQIINNTKYQFIPSELLWLNKISNYKWLYYYGILPKENICSENLTPFIKLLPCRKSNGLSLFLNINKLFNSNYQSMQIHTKPIIISNIKYIKFTQLFQIVFNNFKLK